MMMMMLLLMITMTMITMMTIRRVAKSPEPSWLILAKAREIKRKSAVSWVNNGWGELVGGDTDTDHGNGDRGVMMIGATLVCRTFVFQEVASAMER